MMELQRCWVTKKATPSALATKKLNKLLTRLPAAFGRITRPTDGAALLGLLGELTLTILA